MRDRRGFLQVTGLTMAGGSAAFIAACGGGSKDSSSPSASAPGAGGADVEILNAALDLENTAVAAYAAGTTLLSGKALQAGKLFRDQEQEHADGLAQAIKDLGGTPNKSKSKAEYATALGLDKLKSQRDVLEAALALENMAIAAYLDAMPKLSSGQLRGTAAAILTSEAEHVSVLRTALGEQPAPDAFVTGTKGG